MHKRFIIYTILIVTGLLFISCDFLWLRTSDVKKIDLEKNPKNKNEKTDLTPMDDIKQPNRENRLWSILIYMAADNDLEPAAIEDIFEMELSRLNTNRVSVFILLDRSSSYDTSNKDWSSSKLYKLKTGRSKNNYSIISEEIECENLGLSVNGNTELDMSSEKVLSDSIAFIKEKYPSDYFGFIMWGHGTGWRSTKGFAHDDSTSRYMTLRNFGRALEKGIGNEKIDFLGMDTCFSGEIEVMYEIKNCVKYAVGAEGLILLSGWNYENIFNCFEDSTTKTAEDLVKIIINSFGEEYFKTSAASIIGINMEYMDEYFLQFDNIMHAVSLEITSLEIREQITNELIKNNNNEIKKYSYKELNSDVYLDINSLLRFFKDFFKENKQIQELINKIEEISEKIIVNSWSSDTDKNSLGVYFGTLTAGNLIGTIHDEGYIKGKCTNQIKFVNDSKGYVPNIITGESLLDKLFYTHY